MTRNTRDRGKMIGAGWCGMALVVMVLIILAGAPAGAVTNEENYGQLEFNFVTPGARATAMGGAFIGLADDATAAETNPAGLVILSRPELSFEYKFIDYSREMYLDENSSLEGRKQEISDSTSMPAFFSYVHPFERFTLTVYRNETVNFKQSFMTSGPIVGDTGYQLYPADSSLEMKLTNLGVGGAFKFNEHFSAGATIRYSTFDLDTELTRWEFDRTSVIHTSNVDDSDEQITFNLGLLWTVNPKLSFGGVYRNGGEYDVPWKMVQDTYTWDETLTFSIPEVYGVGMSWRPMEPLVLALDVVRVNYSSLTDNITMIYYEDEQAPSQYAIDDATEFHVGGEYTWLVKGMPLSARAGVYTDPDSSIIYSGGNDADSQSTRIRFPGGEDQVHVTVGTGIVVKDRLQFDAAYDYADMSQQFSLSAIFRF